MGNQPTDLIVCCNHEVPKEQFSSLPPSRYSRLEYDKQPDGFGPNVRLSLRPFVRDVYHLTDRHKDLLEIAGYVFLADRWFRRGSPDAVEHNAWSRSFRFHIKVRDHSFWADPETKAALESALSFLSGDIAYDFTFYPDRRTEATSLFDSEQFRLQPNRTCQVQLFSGGLDSLAGAVEALHDTDRDIYLVSHRSSQPSTTRTQDRLAIALGQSYHGRVFHYKFYCNFIGTRGRDENQRTRSFLYSSIAFSLAHALSLNSFLVYENGVAAINFPNREDMGNARSSRTTHPKTIALFERFFSLVAEQPFTIETPYLWSTKTDVARTLKDHGSADLIASSVSCSRTFRNTGAHTHCGECSQCIDRRISTYAAGLQEIDHPGLYTFDLLTRPLLGETKTLAMDYVRRAVEFAQSSIDMFYDRNINELVPICEALPLTDEEAVRKVFDLHRAHGIQTQDAIQRMLQEHFDLSTPLPKDAFLRLVVDYEHLKSPGARLVERLAEILLSAIPLTFQRHPPHNETDLNDKIEGILASADEKLQREHPAISFGLSTAVPDHSSADLSIVVETKYLREGTTPSKSSEAISADLTKYPPEPYLLFVVYDPGRSIKDDSRFSAAFERKRPGLCKVLIVR